MLQGLCFRIDVKFAPGHRCPSKSLKVLIVDDGEEEEEGVDDLEHAQHVVEELELKVKSRGSQDVRLGNGLREQNRGTCKGVVLTLPLKLGGSDIIMGMKW